MTLAVDACLFAFAGLMALSDDPWWSFALPLIAGAAILAVYGRRAVKALGIHSRDETPHAQLMALALPGGLIGALATQTGRYAGLVIMAYIVLAHIAERVVWTRFRASRRVARQH